MSWDTARVVAFAAFVLSSAAGVGAQPPGGGLVQKFGERAVLAKDRGESHFETFNSIFDNNPETDGKIAVRQDKVLAGSHSVAQNAGPKKKKKKNRRRKLKHVDAR